MNLIILGSGATLIRFISAVFFLLNTGNLLCSFPQQYFTISQLSPFLSFVPCYYTYINRGNYFVFCRMLMADLSSVTTSSVVYKKKSHGYINVIDRHLTLVWYTLQSIKPGTRYKIKLIDSFHSFHSFINTYAYDCTVFLLCRSLTHILLYRICFEMVYVT